MRIKILDRYIATEMASAFALGLAAFTFVLLMNKILRLVELIVTKGVDLLTVLRLFLYVLPYTLVVTIPMAVLLGTLSAFGRLAADGELLPIKGAGVSLLRLVAAPVALGLLAYLLTTYIMVQVLPTSIQSFKNLVFQLTRTRATVGLQEGVFNSDFEGLIVYADRVDPKTSRLERVFIVDGKDGGEQRIIVAKAGSVASDPQALTMTLKLQDGTIHSAHSRDPGRYRLLRFDRYDVALGFGRSLADPIERPRGEQEMTLGELRQRMAALRAEGKNPGPLEVEFHRKLAIPVACLLFPLIGAPLGIRIRRAGRGIGLAVSIAFAVAYYLLIVAGESLGARGIVRPALAMWLPNLAIAAAGALLLVAGATEQPPLALLARVVGLRRPTASAR